VLLLYVLDAVPDALADLRVLFDVADALDAQGGAAVGVAVEQADGRVDLQRVDQSAFLVA
jgi:hypothetical protein